MNEAAERAIARNLKLETYILNLLKDVNLFDDLYLRLQDALTVAWDNQMQSAIKECLTQLKSMPPGEFSEQDANTLLQTLESKVGADALSKVLKKPVISISEALYRAGHTEATDSVGVSPRFGLPDTESAKIAGDGNLYWVANSWNTSTQKIFQRTLQDYFEQGMTRGDLADRFADEFAGLTERHRSYWEMLADHTATKTREMGRVMGMDTAGVSYAQVRANMDSRTTPICRKLNNKIIPISKCVTQVQTYLNAISTRNMDAAKNAWRMVSDSEDIEAIADAPGNVLPADIGTPPYHFRCRTILVAYFGDLPDDPSIDNPANENALTPPDLTNSDAATIRRKVIGLGDDAISVYTISQAELKERLRGVTDKAERQAIRDDASEPLTAKLVEGGRYIEIGFTGLKINPKDVELILKRLRLYGYEPVGTVNPENTDIIRVVRTRER